MTCAAASGNVHRPALVAVATRVGYGWVTGSQRFAVADIEIRGNRYSVPDHLVGALVHVRIGLDEQVQVYADEQLVATYQLQPRS